MGTIPDVNKIAREIMAEARKMNAESNEDVQAIACEIMQAYGLTYTERELVKRTLVDKFGPPAVAHPSER